MRVRRQVKRHAVEEYGEVCAVVEIEAAKEILVGLAAAGVLRDDHARNSLQDFCRTKNRTIVELRFFVVREYQGEIENRIFKDIRWAMPKDLPQFDFLEADLELVRGLAGGKLL